jgi:tetratricopeptide (TPR) repeat protein
MGRRSAGQDPRVDQLIDRGLRLHQAGRVDDALVVWRFVLEIAPGEPRARNLVASIELARSPHQSGVRELPLPGVHGPGGVDRPALEQMLRERRYLDALALLQRALARAPHDAAIARGIVAIREHLVTRFLRRVGGPGTVLHPLVAPSEVELDARELAAMVDGRATVQEILDRAPVSKHEAAAVLDGLVSKGAVIGPGAAAPPGLYEKLFARATEAYLEGDLASAIRLYEACLALRPGDPTATHNLQRLTARVARRA